MRFFFIFIIISVITSCQREIDDVSSTTQSDSIYIESAIILDSSLVTLPNDTLFKFLFEYDIQKRVRRLREFQYVNGVIDFSSDVKYFYIANDSLPSVLQTVSTNGSSTVYDTVYLTYGNSGKILRDSSSYGVPGSPKAFVKLEFQQQGNNLIYGNYIDSVAGFAATRETINSFCNWQSGNLFNEIDTFNYIIGQPPGYIKTKIFSYDQNVNPFRRILLNFPTTGFFSYTLTMAHGNWFLKEFANNSKSNILTEVINPGNYVRTYSYTYSPAGLPVKAVRSSGPTLYKIHYYYTSL